MEEYVDVDISAWAKQIREMKIIELEHLIKLYKNYYKYSDDHFYPQFNVDFTQSNIDKLELKLEILKR